MPPKRKAAAAGGPSHKRARSGTSTPASTPTPAPPPADDSGDDLEGMLEGDEGEGEVKLAKDTRQAHNVMEAISLAGIASRNNAKQRPNRDPAFDTKKGSNDFSYQVLKPDHQNRPLNINPRKGTITFESFHPLATMAQDFLITIGEPVSRPKFVHEYKMTQHSLYAAVSVGLRPDDIIKTLDRFLKVEIPEDVITFIKNFTASFGKLKMVLRDTRYLLESNDAAVLRKVLQDPKIAELGLGKISASKTEKTAGLVIPGTETAAGMKQVNVTTDGAAQQAGQSSLQAATGPAPNITDEDDEDEDEQVFSVPVADPDVEKVSRLCLEMEYPVLEEYDFRRDHINANLDIDLRPNIILRPYQEKSLSKMFGNGRAKSGIIVLPCGAGKTLVGITAACTIKKGCIVLCTSSMSAVQWRKEAVKFSNIDPADVALFTSDSKTTFRGNTGIIVTTYSMITNSRKRSYESQKMMDFLGKREWGLMLLDEVHVVPAKIFRKVISNIKTHCKLGLTATLLREDDRIDDLNYLIGPKLYEANWMELSEQGHIAKVQCAEVWCSMPPDWYKEYLNATNDHRKQELLYAMNPNKLRACQYLINYHEARGDKVIIFSDNIYALQEYSESMKKYYLHGGTSQSERMNCLNRFQNNDPLLQSIFLSKIGDTSLDLPEATVLIQISSQYGSRRQEAQRLGRILRAKRRNDEGFNAFFYSLVSTATNETHYCSRRQAFLVDQGYAFKVITELKGMDDMPGLLYSTPEEKSQLLSKTQSAWELTKKDKVDMSDSLLHQVNAQNQKKWAARRTAGGLAGLSGAQGMTYTESKKVALGKKSAFFRKLDRDKDRRKKVLEEEGAAKPAQYSGKKNYY